MKKKLKIGVLISGGGSNLQAIIDACKAGRIDGKIVFVGSDKAGVFGLERAKKNDIPTFVVDYSKTEKMLAAVLNMQFGLSQSEVERFIERSSGIIPKSIHEESRDYWLRRRFEAESRLLKEMGKYDFDLLVLAGFMKTMSAFLIDQVNTDPECPRIMNIHPALLPAFPGTDGYSDTFRYGCKTGGCTVHFVDYGEDTGPIIGQRAIPILPGESLESFKDRGLKEEWLLYPECIQLFAEGKLRVVEKNGRRIVEIVNP